MKKNVYFCNMVQHYSYPGEVELHNLKKALNTIVNRCKTPSNEEPEAFDEKGYSLFFAFASHLAEHALHCLEEWDNVCADECVIFSFDDYAELTKLEHESNYCMCVHDNLYSNKDGYFENEREYGIKIATLRGRLIQTLSESITSLELQYRQMIFDVEWHEGKYKEIARKLYKIKSNRKTEWERDHEINKLIEANNNALEQNLFGKYYIDDPIYLDKPTEQDNNLESRIPEIIYNHIIQKKETQHPANETSINTEAFSYDQELKYFCELRAIYLLLNNKKSTYFDDLEEEQEETQQPDTYTTPQAPDNYNPEERQKIINCYKGLANFMAIDTHWITDIFKPDDDRLWAAIKADGQKRLLHPNHPDGTNIAPLLNLLGVLCRTGKLEKGASEYYNKLLTNFPYLTKGEVGLLVKNGSRDNPRKLASIIEKRLNNLPI